MTDPQNPDNEEEDGPRIRPSDEMAEALREAEAAVGSRPSGAETGKESADKMTIEALSQELQALKEEFEARGRELEEANDRHLRLQAEFENFRRRTIKEKQESAQYGQQNLVKDLLSTVDNLERALGHASETAETDLQSLLEGVELVHRELLGALGKHGVTVVNPAGEEFDPAFHEAMGQVPSEEVAPNGVIEVLQQGYMLKDRMLRPARVIVAAAAAKESEPSQG